MTTPHADRPQTVTPTRIIPPGVPLPPTAPPDWWHQPPAPGPGPLDIHVTVDLVLPGPEPAPEPSWWQRIRWIYNAGCAGVALPLSGPWAALLIDIRQEQGLVGAWTLAAVPLAVLALLDNARRVEARHADPDAWAPRIRAAITRTALWAAVIATIAALPVETLVFVITGVRS